MKAEALTSNSRGWSAKLPCQSCRTLDVPKPKSTFTETSYTKFLTFPLRASLTLALFSPTAPRWRAPPTFCPPWTSPAASLTLSTAPPWGVTSVCNQVVSRKVGQFSFYSLPRLFRIVSHRFSAPTVAAQAVAAAASPAPRTAAVRWQRDRVLGALARHTEASRRGVAVRTGAAGESTEKIIDLRSL